MCVGVGVRAEVEGEDAGEGEDAAWRAGKGGPRVQVGVVWVKRGWSGSSGGGLVSQVGVVWLQAAAGARR